MKRLLTLVVMCLYITRSYQSLHLSADPVKVEIGVTKTLDLRCSLPRINGTQNISVASIIISRSNASHEAHFHDLVSVTVPDRVHNLADHLLGNATVSGKVGDQEGSHISVSWTSPEEDLGGLYKCVAYGVDDIGHPAELVVFVLVSVESPNMDNFAVRIRELTESAVKMRKYYHYLGEKLTAAATTLK